MCQNVEYESTMKLIQSIAMAVNKSVSIFFLRSRSVLSSAPNNDLPVS